MWGMGRCSQPAYEKLDSDNVSIEGERDGFSEMSAVTFLRVSLDSIDTPSVATSPTERGKHQYSETDTNCSTTRRRQSIAGIIVTSWLYESLYDKAEGTEPSLWSLLLRKIERKGIREDRCIVEKSRIVKTS
jgi:hypothetical protein